jgi:hypothetical protein
LEEEIDEELQRRESAEESGAIPDDFMEPKKSEERESGQILDTSQEISIKKAVAKLKEPVSKLLQVLVQVEAFFNRFQKDPIPFVDKNNAKTVSSYPKYLQKFSLLSLQFKDFMFRETFIYQVIVFLDCLKNPIKD